MDATNKPGSKDAAVPGDALRRIPPRQGGWIGKVQAVIESLRFQRMITVLIVLNAITLGLETSAEVRDAAGHSNVTVTSGYLHVAVEDDGVGALFG